MRSRSLLLSFICPSFILAIVLLAAPGHAATALVHDGDTIQLGEMTFHLDGIDAPEFDQGCIDDHADPFACGAEARDQLTRLIGGHPVHCDDLGPDKSFKKRHAGLCTVEGEPVSLNQQLVQQGLALSVDGSGKTSFNDDAKAAREAKRGLWKGCFAAPQDFRAAEKNGALLGAACRADRDTE